VFLATTALSEFWDKDQEILFLGSWCLRYDRRAEWQNLQYRVLEDPWADRRLVAEAFRYCTEVFEHTLTELTEYLNGVHGVEHSSRYWRVLLGPWLLEYIQALYDRYVHMRAALEQAPGLTTMCLASECFVTPRNLRDFREWSPDDPYNLQLYSQVIGLMGKDMPTQTWSVAVAPVFVRGTSRVSTTGLPVKRLVNRLAAHFASQAVIANMSIGAGSLWEIIREGRFRVWPVAADPPEPEDTIAVSDLRAGLSSLKARDEFEKILMCSLAINLPTLYLEGYKEFRRRCLKGWRRVPRVVMSENGWYTNESFKFRAAEWAEGGARLLGMQHGGGYGTSAMVPQEWHERMITDRFFAWGWAESERDGRLANMPHPRLCRFAESARRPGFYGEGLLLIANAYLRFPYRFHAAPIGDQVEQYLDDRIMFLNGLSGSAQNEAAVRLYPTDYGWAAKQRLVESCANLRFDDIAVPCEKRLASCRLAVFDHPGTTYLEGLALNVPTVLFWRPSLWEEREPARPFFAELRKALILHDDPKTAAAHASAVYDDPWRWWGSEEVQAARRRFVERFAYARADWVKLWTEALRSEASAAGSAVEATGARAEA